MHRGAPRCAPTDHYFLFSLHVVTGDKMPTATVAERWYDLAADLGRQGTTAVEAAARRGINRCGDFALECQLWGRLARIGLGDSGQERPRIRVLRVRKHLLDRPHFDDLANVHHHHTVTDVPT